MLRANPDLIDEWVKLSENKRTRYGWGLVRPCSSESADWIVVYPNGRRRHSFPDGFKACAYFVKQEIEGYRANL